ncbi:hypothetical protein PIB30_032097 [Stylosanthes scabra]|nr:hypothetical protein [Stylosanthes scabra]
MGEKEWYFFCVRDRKYPTGLRTNRATEAGYWKATGKDKEIHRGKSLVGMKKTLVFYKGRAPKGHKSDWVMHEFRLDGQFNPHNLPKSAKNEWVICRVFHKSSSGKKIHISGIMRLDSYGNQQPTPLPDCSPCNTYVPCFSNPIIDPFALAVNAPSNSWTAMQPVQEAPNSTYSCSHHQSQEHSILRALLENNSGFKAAEREMPLTASLETETSPHDLATLWNYQVQIK